MTCICGRHYKKDGYWAYVHVAKCIKVSEWIQQHYPTSYNTGEVQ